MCCNRSLPHLILTWLGIVFSLTLSGCDGCRSRRLDQDSASKQKDDQAEQEEDFTSQEIRILPTDANLAGQAIKPGHWLSLQHSLKSNRADFYGELETVVAGRDRVQMPIRLARSEAMPRSLRPVVLPKGQNKTFEQAVFVPHEASRSPRIWVYDQLQARLGGGVQLSQSQVVNRMEPYQTFFVVLARRPDAYGYLKTLESIRPPFQPMDLTGIQGDYVMVIPEADKAPMLPSWSLMWTGISYMIWDDYDPLLLSTDQQRAMLDWLHWGGQLIVSGPSSLDRLKSSFLNPYLPVENATTRTFLPAEVAKLNEFWSFASAQSKIDPSLQLDGESALPVLEMKLTDAGKFVDGTARLVAERQIGRGRICMTAFPLAARPLTNWRRFDNFFNNCLLRRPPRSYTYTDDTGTVSHWPTDVVRALSRFQSRSQVDSGRVMIDDEDLPLVNAGVDFYRGRTASDALVTTRNSYFSRDAYRSKSAEDVRDNLPPALSDLLAYRCDSHAGLAGWNDFSECSEIARAALREAAGIEVPDRSLIFWSLGLYLFILVPANWTIFRALGRVEWAWAAVPVLAILGTIAVVRLAQLDVGFASSQTELAVVELQPGFTRAHVTRYLGFYTSLSSNYELSFRDESSVVLPFAKTTTTMGPSRQVDLVTVARPDQRDAAVQLTELAVNSNTTGMVHSEEMLDLEGVFEWKSVNGSRFDLTNNTAHRLNNVGILRRHRDRTEFASATQLGPGAKVRVEFSTLNVTAPEDAWTEFGDPQSDAALRLNLRPLLSLAADSSRLNEGDVRMIALSSESLPGMTVVPEPSQTRSRNVWVVNLAYGDILAPESDVNAPEDVDQNYLDRDQNTTLEEAESDRTD